MATLSSIAADVKSHLSTNISDTDVMWAYDEFSFLVENIKENRYDDGGKSAQVSIPIAGYDLTNITDIKSYNVGFKVFKGDDVTDLKAEDKLERIDPGLTCVAGYFIIGDTLYLKNIDGVRGKISSATDVVIVYNEKRTTYSIGSDPDNVTFPYDQDLIIPFRRYLQTVFFDSKFKPENVAAAQQQAIAWLNTYFGNPQSV